MARTFNGSTQHLSAAAAVSAWPLSYFAWIYPTTLGASASTIMSISNTGNENPLQWMYLNGATPAKATCQARGALTDISTATGTTTITVDTWFSIGAVIGSTGTCIIYTNGADKVTGNAAADSMGAVNTTSIGALVRGAVSLYFTGSIAECAVWSVALTDAEMASLGKGISPLLIRPASRASYWPLIGRSSPEIDLDGALDMTLTNAPTTGVHPRIIYPSSRRNSIPSAAAAGGAAEFLASRLALTGVGH